MNFIELIDGLPQLFNWFVPGFISIAIYKYLVDTKEKDFEITIVGSIVCSYIFQLLSKLICSLIKINETGISFTGITLLLAVVFTILFVRFRLTSFYKRIISHIGKTTGNKSIWYDFFDLNKGTRIRFYTKFNHQNVEIEGDVKYFEPYGEGECDIVIANYKIKYQNDNIYQSQESALMIFKTQDIYGVEALYGQ